MSMSLSREDREYFDARFDKVDAKIDGLHGRITEHALEDQRMFSLSATTIQQAMTTHEERRHNWGKLFAFLSSIVVVAAAIIAGILWLIERAGNY